MKNQKSYTTEEKLQLDEKQKKDEARRKAEREHRDSLINSQNTTKEKVIAILAFCSGWKESEVQADTIIYYEGKSEFGFDYLDIIEALMEIERAINIPFPDALVQDIRGGKVYDHPKFKTVKDLIDICELLQRLSKIDDFKVLLKIIREN